MRLYDNPYIFDQPGQGVRVSAHPGLYAQNAVMPATPKQIAEWMAKQLEDGTLVYQEVAAYAIASKFGDQFTYLNDNSNLAIRKDVLAAFRKITGNSVVWDRGERYWRKREPGDPTGRQQDS